jgi:hypothetical protein
VISMRLAEEFGDFCDATFDSPKMSHFVR